MAQFTDNEKQEFLNHLAECGVIGRAMAMTGINARQTITRWRKDDPDFAAAYDEALEASRDSLESEARRRAVEGVTKIKFYPKGHEKAGEPYIEYEYSDGLLMFLLKGERADKFADRVKSEISGPNGGAIETNDTAMAARLAAILDSAKQRKAAAGDSDPLFE